MLHFRLELEAYDNVHYIYYIGIVSFHTKIELNNFNTSLYSVLFYNVILYILKSS